MLIQRLIVIITTLVLSLISSFGILAINAEASLKSNIQSEHSEINNMNLKPNDKIEKVQSELLKIKAQMNKVNQAINDNKNMIVQTENNIKNSKLDIKKIEKELEIVIKRIDKRTVILKGRAKSFQESGGNVKYFDVLIGAESFSDFVDRVGAVTTILEADKELLEQHEIDKQIYEEKKAELEKKINILTKKIIELEGMQSQILEQKNQGEQLKKQLKQIEMSNISKNSGVKIENSRLKSNDQKIVAAKSTSSEEYSISSSNDTAAKGSSNISDVISAGYKYIGNSVYVFGGGRTESDIANGRFDCSGFVNWAFSQAGYKIGSSTEALKTSGTQIPVSDMQPGDLVFFDTYKKDGHVGIYIGNGEFIGSQSSTGVAVANMSSGYWKEKFNGRVIRI